MQSISRGSRMCEQTGSLGTRRTPAIENYIEKFSSNFRRASVHLQRICSHHERTLNSSWKPDPAALTVDALSISWKGHYPYIMFPPFALIPHCLSKLEEEEVTAVLIAPVWTNQVWFPLLLSSLMDFPILPATNNILTSSQGTNHPMVKEGHLPLGAWPVSGDHGRTFRRSYRNPQEVMANLDRDSILLCMETLG